MKNILFKITDYENEKIELLKNNEEIKKNFANNKITRTDIIRLSLQLLFKKFNIEEFK